MKNNKLTVSIGIPAYNEELNIKSLINSLLKQKLKNVYLKEIVIISDASTDSTVKTARSIKNSKVKVIDRKERLGLNTTQNQILSLINGDFLILLDADVLPSGENFIECMIKPIILDKSVGLVGADIVSVKPQKFFERIIADSHEFKYSFYKKINHGANIYVCHGRASAFSKKLYSALRWPKYPAEDSYAYLYCLDKGYKFVFVPEAKIYFRSPSTFSDHLKQSKRFFGEQRHMENYFSQSLVKEEYKIPKVLLIQSVSLWFFKNPITLIFYLVIAFYIKYIISINFKETSSWDPSISTKKIIHE